MQVKKEEFLQKIMKMMNKRRQDAMNRKEAQRQAEEAFFDSMNKRRYDLWKRNGKKWK